MKLNLTKHPYVVVGAAVAALGALVYAIKRKKEKAAPVGTVTQQAQARYYLLASLVDAALPTRLQDSTVSNPGALVFGAGNALAPLGAPLTIVPYTDNLWVEHANEIAGASFAPFKWIAMYDENGNIGHGKDADGNVVNAIVYPPNLRTV